MLLQLLTVSRKTPRDGKLEISETVARRLAPLGEPLPLRVGESAGESFLTEMACHCEKGAHGATHVHHFLASPLFQSLEPGQTVTLELTGGGAGQTPALVVSLPHPL